MDEGRKDSSHSRAGMKSGKRGFTLPSMPLTSRTPMPSVNPPKGKEDNEKKEGIKNRKSGKKVKGD